MTTCYRLLAGAVPGFQNAAAELAARLGRTCWLPETTTTDSSALVRAYTDAWIRWLLQDHSESLGLHQLVAVHDGEIQVVRFPGRGRLPMLLLHGWPTSFLAFHKVVEPLQNQASEVILGVLPGFGVGETSAGGLAISSIASAFAEAMTTIGHDEFVVHGQDWGSVVARQMAAQHPERVLGVHVSAGLRGFIADSVDCGPVWERLRDFADKGSSYLHLQTHRPQSLAVGLGDSPAGLLAWQLDKYQLWQGDLGPDFGLGVDFILANATFYWATQTIGSSMRIYADNRLPLSMPPSSVPTGVSVFGAGDFASHRVSARDNNLIAWYEHSVGGHVAALDAESEFTSDLTDFLTKLEAA